MHFKPFSFLIVVIICIGFQSCSSIVSKTSYPLHVNSTPSDATVSIKDRHGVTLFRGVTPITVKLKAGYNYFTRAHYTLVYEKEGYQTKSIPVTFSIDGWYFGNILLSYPGFIGMLIIDPATGAMWKIDNSYVHETLQKTTEKSGEMAFKVIELNDVPTEAVPHLVSLKH